MSGLAQTTALRSFHWTTRRHFGPVNNNKNLLECNRLFECCCWRCMSHHGHTLAFSTGYISMILHHATKQKSHEYDNEPIFPLGCGVHVAILCSGYWDHNFSHFDVGCEHSLKFVVVYCVLPASCYVFCHCHMIVWFIKNTFMQLSKVADVGLY